MSEALLKLIVLSPTPGLQGRQRFRLETDDGRAVAGVLKLSFDVSAPGASVTVTLRDVEIVHREEA